MPYVLEPLVAGELGEGTVLDTSTHPPIARSVEYVLDVPIIEDLIESFPVFLVSEKLSLKLSEANLKGFSLDEARVIPSEGYRDGYGDAPHPYYRWLRLQSVPAPDCWLDSAHRLCVSETMMAVLSKVNIDGCNVTRF